MIAVTRHRYHHQLAVIDSPQHFPSVRQLRGEEPKVLHGLGAKNKSASLADRCELIQRGLDLRILHEVFPHEPCPAVFDHDLDWRLVQSHEDRRDPVLIVVERVAETVFAPELRATVTVKVLERGKRFVRRVRVRRQGTGRCDGAVVLAISGFVRQVPKWIVARREAPRIRTVTGVLAGIHDAVLPADASDVAIIDEVVGVAIRKSVRIKSHKRIVSEEQRAAKTLANIKPDPIVGVPVGVATPQRPLYAALFLCVGSGMHCQKPRDGRSSALLRADNRYGSQSFGSTAQHIRCSAAETPFHNICNLLSVQLLAVPSCFDRARKHGLLP